MGVCNLYLSRKVSVTEGDWSFDIITSSGGGSGNTATITYYSGQSAEIVIIPSVLGGTRVTEIAAQAFGHHSEIRAVYVPDSVASVEDWAFYDLNEASIIAFANLDVSISDGAFQSSGNASLYLPEGTSQTSAGGKEVITDGTETVGIAIVNPESAAIAGGNYLSVTGDYAVTSEMIIAIARSASGEESDVVYEDGTITFYGPAYEAEEQQVEIYPDFADDVSEADLTQTFWSLTEEDAASMNEAIASDASYSAVAIRLNFEVGYYLNGNKVELAEDAVAYDVQNGEAVALVDGRFPSSSTSGYYKYVFCRDTDNDGQIDIIYYSPFDVTYSYNTVTIISENENLNGLSSRDRLNPLYLTFANAVVSARGEGNNISEASLSLATSNDGDVIGAGIDQERSILWADDYAAITVNELHAASTSFANWAKMSYVVGLTSYNVEIAMEWGMNALLYATNGGVITVGSLNGPVSTFSGVGDAANGAIAGGSGTKAGTDEALFETSSVHVYNADFTLEGWNNHVADVVYGGYAYLEKIDAATGKPGSYAVGQGSALANDFGNGVVDVKDFNVVVYGNRSAGIYVIGGGVITAENSTFISKMDAGAVIASGGTLKINDCELTGQIALRGRGGITSSSVSDFTNTVLTAEKDIDAYVTGELAVQAVSAWQSASGGTELASFMMSDPEMTIGSLCENYGMDDSAQNALLSELSELASAAYTSETPLRNSLLDNTYYNYSAGAFTGSTDFSEVPYLTVGSAFGGLISAVIGFESAGVVLNMTNCAYVSNNGDDYNYLIASEAGSALVVNFIDSEASGIIWNEGSVRRAVEGMVSNRSSSLTVNFESSNFTGSFADGSNGLWGVYDLSYTNGAGEISNLNGNYYGASANWGTSVVLGQQSTWTVTYNSFLGGLTIEEGAEITARDGGSLSMTVNGVETEIAPGMYSGEIIIMPSEAN